MVEITHLRQISVNCSQREDIFLVTIFLWSPARIYIGTAAFSHPDE